MKNLITFNYNLVPENLIEEKSFFSFYIDYIKFYFVEINRPQEDIEKILNIILNYTNNFHEIIPNKMGNIFTQHMDKNYILLKLKTPEHKEIDITDIINNMIEFNSQDSHLLRIDWSKLWSEKVDYLEYQVSELSTSHKIIMKSFSYYVGLAENAITYFNMLNPKGLNTAIAHRRMKYPFITSTYYNPLDIIIDYRVRDIAGYIKRKFFEEPASLYDEIETLINKNIFNALEYNLLFCRLLYPSYYFDDMQKILEKKEDDDIVLKYIENTKQYELFLKNVYNRLSKTVSMIKIPWLID